MASNLKAFLKGNRTKHVVGNISSFRQPQTITNGAVATEDVDVFTLVELGVSANKELTCKYATGAATLGNIFLHVTPQNVLESFGEQRSDFYVANGEKANLAYLEKGLTFFTSAITGTPAVGALVVWDATAKKFSVKAPAETDVHVFQIQDLESEEGYTIDGATIVELRVVK